MSSLKKLSLESIVWTMELYPINECDYLELANLDNGPAPVTPTLAQPSVLQYHRSNCITICCPVDCLRSVLINASPSGCPLIFKVPDFK